MKECPFYVALFYSSARLADNTLGSVVFDRSHAQRLTFVAPVLTLADPSTVVLAVKQSDSQAHVGAGINGCGGRHGARGRSTTRGTPPWPCPCTRTWRTVRGQGADVSFSTMRNLRKELAHFVELFGGAFSHILGARVLRLVHAATRRSPLGWAGLKSMYKVHAAFHMRSACDAYLAVQKAIPRTIRLRNTAYWTGNVDMHYPGDAFTTGIVLGFDTIDPTRVLGPARSSLVDNVADPTSSWRPDPCAFGDFEEFSARNSFDWSLAHVEGHAPHEVVVNYAIDHFRAIGLLLHAIQDNSFMYNYDYKENELLRRVTSIRRDPEGKTLQFVAAADRWDRGVACILAHECPESAIVRYSNSYVLMPHPPVPSESTLRNAKTAKLGGKRKLGQLLNWVHGAKNAIKPLRPRDGPARASQHLAIEPQLLWLLGYKTMTRDEHASELTELIQKRIKTSDTVRAANAGRRTPPSYMVELPAPRTERIHRRIDVRLHAPARVGLYATYGMLFEACKEGLFFAGGSTVMSRCDERMEVRTMVLAKHAELEAWRSARYAPVTAAMRGSLLVRHLHDCPCERVTPAYEGDRCQSRLARCRFCCSLGAQAEKDTEPQSMVIRHDVSEFHFSSYATM